MSEFGQRLFEAEKISVELLRQVKEAEAEELTEAEETKDAE